MAKWANIDFSELKQLRDQLEKVDPDTMSRKVVKELAKRMLAKVVKRTPVGKYNQPVSFVTKEGKRVSFTPSSGKTGGTLRRGWEIGGVIKKGNYYEVEVYNPVLYASYVEFGHRTANHQGWVTGQFMMTISANEIEQASPKIAERIIMREMKEAFEI